MERNDLLALGIFVAAVAASLIVTFLVILANG